MRFFSEEQQTISFSALSARDSIAISMVAPSPSSAFMPCACYIIKHNLNLTETMTSEK